MSNGADIVYQLIHTSLPHGLKPGSSGYVTAACTRGLSPKVISILEGMSWYKAVYPHYSENAYLNPKSYFHYHYDFAGNKYDILSRIMFAGADYSGRSNYLAHHVMMETGRRTACGPAALCSLNNFFISKWEGEPRLIDASHEVPDFDEPFAYAKTWKELTGDAGWAGKLVESWLAAPDKPVYIVVEPQVDSLLLLREAICLLPKKQRWDVTFNTYFTKMPTGFRCSWRFCLPDCAEMKEAQRIPGTTIIDLTQPLNKAFGGVYVEGARTGVEPRIAEPAGESPSKRKFSLKQENAASPSEDVLPPGIKPPQNNAPAPPPPSPVRQEQVAPSINPVQNLQIQRNQYENNQSPLPGVPMPGQYANPQASRKGLNTREKIMALTIGVLVIIGAALLIMKQADDSDSIIESSPGADNSLQTGAGDRGNAESSKSDTLSSDSSNKLSISYNKQDQSVVKNTNTAKPDNDVTPQTSSVVDQDNLIPAPTQKLVTKPVQNKITQNDIDIALFPLRMWLNMKSFKDKFKVRVVGNDESQITLVPSPKYIKPTPEKKIYLDAPSPKGEGVDSYLKIWLILEDNKCELAVKNMGNKLPEPLVEVVQSIRIGKCKYNKNKIFIKNIGKIISVEKEDDKKIIVKIKNDQINQQIFNAIKTMNGDAELLSAGSSKLKKFTIKIPENQDDNVVLEGKLPKPVNYADEINRLKDQIARMPDKRAGVKRKVEEELKQKFDSIRGEYEKLKSIKSRNSHEEKKWLNVEKEYERVKKQYNDAKNALPDKLKEINELKQQLETRKKRLEEKQRESQKQSDAAKNNITNIGKITFFYNKMKLREYEQ